MMANYKYPQELRERATRLAVEARRDPDTRTGAINRIAEQTGVHKEALRTWVRKAEDDELPTEPVDAEARIRRLEKENRELRQSMEILRSATAFFAKGGVRPPTEVIVAFIDEHKHRWGIEPICRVLSENTEIKIAPGTYYAFIGREPSARARRDAVLKEHIMRIHTHPRMRVYGIRKIHAQLVREGHEVARCTIERLCRELGVRGTVRGKWPRTTKPAPETDRPRDLVERDFTATAPNQLWVADLTYVRTHSGWVYVAFVLDVFSRRIVGWQTSTRMYTDLALDALKMGLWSRRRAGQDVTGLVHHSDRGVQYRALRYAQALDAAEAVASVGSKGDSFDNAMAEALNSLYKAELIFLDGPWAGWEDVEAATAQWVHWFNTERVHGMLEYRTPTEVEAAYYAQSRAASAA
ncbi:IS3 family transposase [Rhodococcus sp. T2V]|uniref:IS3 family transposase n=1 Tax=Rhodococcus sp. T2V TaxID=3034164 RepID=UPI0023E1BAB7|nr:IS3 family transposase [Rhodococcus sp. T2V]MDF3312193.1 IS3 family transposase [Rhodococcus sp. T2V]